MCITVFVGTVGQRPGLRALSSPQSLAWARGSSLLKSPSALTFLRRNFLWILLLRLCLKPDIKALSL